MPKANLIRMPSYFLKYIQKLLNGKVNLACTGLCFAMFLWFVEFLVNAFSGLEGGEITSSSKSTTVSGKHLGSVFQQLLKIGYLGKQGLLYDPSLGAF